MCSYGAVPALLRIVALSRNTDSYRACRLRVATKDGLVRNDYSPRTRQKRVPAGGVDAVTRQEHVLVHPMEMNSGYLETVERLDNVMRGPMKGP